MSARTRGTAPVATLLSGGVDSALVAHAAAAVGVTQSFGLTMPGEDEVTAQQLRLAGHLGLAHETVAVTASGMIDAFASTVRRIGAPIARLGPVGMHMLASRVRESGIRMCLSGEGADEIFCGYDSFRLSQITSDTDAALFSKLGKPEITVDSGELYWKFASTSSWNPLRKRLATARFLTHFLATDAHEEIAELDRMADEWEHLSDRAEAIRAIEIEYTMGGYLLGPQGDHVWASQAVEMRYPWLALPVTTIGLALEAKNLFSLAEGKVLIRRLARDWFDESWLQANSIDFTKRAYRIDINVILGQLATAHALREFIDGCPRSVLNVDRVQKMMAACLARGVATDRESSVLTLAASLGVLL